VVIVQHGSGGEDVADAAKIRREWGRRVRGVHALSSTVESLHAQDNTSMHLSRFKDWARQEEGAFCTSGVSRAVLLIRTLTRFLSVSLSYL
jgi:hypothetical protein